MKSWESLPTEGATWHFGMNHCDWYLLAARPTPPSVRENKVGAALRTGLAGGWPILSAAPYRVACCRGRELVCAVI